MEEPPAGVLAAFGASAAPAPLPGGQHQVWRSGHLVLKPLDVSLEELRWRAAVLADLDGAPGLRVAPPVLSADGGLVVDGWTAWRYEPGSPPRADQYEQVVAAGRVLHRHLADLPRPAFLDGHDHPWAVADRVAWAEQDVDDDGGRLPHVRTLLEARRPLALPAQLVHGDLTDNVHLHPDLAPLVLDLTPYWRPPSYATAVVVADAVVFRGAGRDLVDRVRDEEGAHFPQLLVRALLFRAVADHLLAPDKDPQWPDWFGPAARYAAEIARG
ncbi:TIGR02569 family protein [Georgenia phoenicis]|uniref:TIGR02569 family protein n=1 Tax=unclassified Georgenia TaxID=2626815 RepID=UPI0039AEABAE